MPYEMFSIYKNVIKSRSSITNNYQVNRSKLTSNQNSVLEPNLNDDWTIDRNEIVLPAVVVWLIDYLVSICNCMRSDCICLAAV